LSESASSRLRSLFLRRARGFSGLHARTRVVSLALALLLMVLAVAELVRPGVASVGIASDAPGGASLVMAGNAPDETGWLPVIRRRSLFEPAVPLPSRRMAKHAVEKILGMLALSAITDIDGQRVAYIRVKGFGMRRFCEGEGMEEMFKVLRIGRKSVQLEVVGERLELAL